MTRAFSFKARLLPLAAFLVVALVLLQPGQGNAAPAVVSALLAAGATVTPLDERGGLAGYWVEPAEGDGYALYVTEDGHAVMGLLYSADGDLVTPEQLTRLAQPEPPAAPRAAAAPAAGTGDLQRLASAAAFTLGAGGPPVVVFADPACIFSRSTVVRLADAALTGQLQLHVVPVALLGEHSAALALDVAGSADPAGAWFARSPAADAPAGARETIAANNALFAAAGGTAVPYLAWQSGRALAFHTGTLGDALPWMLSSSAEPAP